MKALVWHGKGDVRLDKVPDPKIEASSDVIIKVTLAAICGSDLHLYDGFMPTMKKGDILGHETMGTVVEVGPSVKTLKKGDRVVVAFPISCGECLFCQQGLFSLCDRSNPSADMASKVMGQSPAGIYGYSHLLGGYAGGQAEYLRVPYADVGALQVDPGIQDEKVLFLSDIYPTGYMAAENCALNTHDIVAVWGCGPVGQFAIKSARLLGAGRVVAIDRVPERLEMAERESGAITIDFEKEDVYKRLMQITGNKGPHSCIDAVGTEAAGFGITADASLDVLKKSAFVATDRPHVLREAIFCCRKGGTVSLAGVYVGFLDKVPLGAAMNKGLTFKMGQTHVQRYMRPLYEKIVEGVIDPSFVITHRLSLDDAPRAYKIFRDKKEGCVKVVLKPDGAAT